MFSVPGCEFMNAFGVWALKSSPSYPFLNPILTLHCWEGTFISPIAVHLTLSWVPFLLLMSCPAPGACEFQILVPRHTLDTHSDRHTNALCCAYWFCLRFSLWRITHEYRFVWASQVALVLQIPPANLGDIRDAVSIFGLGRSPGGGNGNPF